MAFFGLTGLGSQGSFDCAKETPLHVFEAPDFQHAFMQTYRPGFALYSESDDEVAAARATLSVATITYSQIPEALQRLYKCPSGLDNVPKTTYHLVGAEFEPFRVPEVPITLAEFQEGMTRASQASEVLQAQHKQREYLKDGVVSREYVSGLEFRAAMSKHTRMEKDPRDKLLIPVTDTHTLGWRDPTVLTVRRPNKSCDETKYASAMVKAGVYYY